MSKLGFGAKITISNNIVKIKNGQFDAMFNIFPRGFNCELRFAGLLLGIGLTSAV